MGVSDITAANISYTAQLGQSCQGLDGAMGRLRVVTLTSKGRRAVSGCVLSSECVFCFCHTGPPCPFWYMCGRRLPPREGHFFRCNSKTEMGDGRNPSSGFPDKKASFLDSTARLAVGLRAEARNANAGAGAT